MIGTLALVSTRKGSLLRIDTRKMENAASTQRLPFLPPMSPSTTLYFNCSLRSLYMYIYMLPYVLLYN